MFIQQVLLAQLSIPGVTPLEPGAEAPPADGLFDQVWGAATNSTEDLEIPSSLNKLWAIAMDGSMYRTICFLGMLIAVFAVGFWCVKFYKTIDEGGLKPAATEMIFPLILVVMLSNNGKNMKDLTLGARDAMNGFNVTLNKVVDAEVSLRSATDVLRNFDTIISFADSQVKSCQSETEYQRFEQCMAIKGAQVQTVSKGLERLWPSSGAGSGNGAKWQQEIQDWKDYTANYTKNRFNTSTLDVMKGGNILNKITDIGKVRTFKDTTDLRAVILSFRGSFLYIVEVMMLVTALVGPVFLALSLFPVGTKPLLTWGVSFLTLGFCKICFSLISGLSSLAMVLSGPNNVDMLVTSIVLGLLAPVLAVSVASGSGLATLSSIGYSAQPFKISTGITPYSPQVIDNDSNGGGKKKVL
jgi:hypothetical protein